jgi:4-carboxymuconolactone decarboxylase
MSLLPLLEPGQGDEAQNRFLAQALPLNLYKSLAHAPLLAERTSSLARGILYETALDATVRELAILRAAAAVGCAYEIGHHERIGRDVGLTEAQLGAVREGGDLSALAPRERLACDFASEIAASGRAAEQTTRQVIDAFGQTQAVELCMTIGCYLMVASFLTTFSVPFEGAGFRQGVDIHARPTGR